MEPNAAGLDGITECPAAQAELGFRGDFAFSASYLGRFAVGDDVLFSVRQLPTACGKHSIWRRR